MKIILNLLILLTASSSIAQIQHLYANWNSNTQTYSNPQPFTSIAISEDYGPRSFNGYDYHGGIDIGKDDITNPTILGDGIIAPFSGEVVFIDDSGTKNLIVKFSNDEYIGYRHIFEGASSGTQQLGGFVMTRTDVEEELVIINLIANPLKALSKVNGDTVSYDINGNGIIEEDEVITTTNTFEQFQNLAPIGNSSTSDLAPHFHIQSIKELKDINGNSTSEIENINEIKTFEDLNSFNPLYDFDYTGVGYDVDLSNFSNLNQSSLVKIRVGVVDEHKTDLIKRYEGGMFDIQNVSLRIGRANENVFSKMIKDNGDYIEFDFGGKNSTPFPIEVIDSSQSENKWEISPTAYNSEYFDDYYLSLSEFNSKAIDPTIIDVDNNGLPEINNEALYGDGLYRLKALVEPIIERNPFFYENIGPFESNVSESFIIDNFFPYAERVLIEFSSQDVYHRRWERNGEILELIGPDEGAIFEDGDEFHVQIFTSEPLENLNLRVDGIPTVFPLDPTPEKTQWDIDLIYFGPTIQRDLILTGTDTNGRNLLTEDEIPILSNHIINETTLLARQSSSGEDRSHSINNFDSCQTQANAGQDVTINLGEEVQLQGSGGSTYSWSPTTGLDNPNIFNPTASPSETTTYTLTVTENGCSDTDTVTVIVDGSMNNEPPNNDNCNDAIFLTSNTSCNPITGTVAFATEDSSLNDLSCDAHPNPNGFGVFYSFIAQDNTHSIIVNPTDVLDAVVAVYEGNTCAGLIEFECEDTPGGNGVTTILTNNTFEVGEQYWIRIYDYGNVEPPINEGGFSICVIHPEGNGANGPDLVGNIVSISNNNPNSGQNISVEYEVTNIGDEALPFAFISSLYLSTNQSFDSDEDMFLATEGTQPLSPGETETFTYNVEIPNVDDGQYYLIAFADSLDINDESNESNNIDTSIIQIGDIEEDGSDLEVDDIDVIPDSNLQAGQQINVEIRIENNGNEDAESVDLLVFLDIDDDGNFDSNEFIEEINFGYFDAGEEKTRDRDVHLPVNIPNTGSYNIIAIVDSNNENNETDESNNDRDVQIFINDVNPAGPDVVGGFINFENPDTGNPVDISNLCLNENYRLRYFTENIGNVGTMGSSRTRVFISEDEILDGYDKLYDSANTNDLDPSEIDDEVETEPMEGFSTGQHYLLISTDFNNEIDEVNEVNNTLSIPINFVDCGEPLPDLDIQINSFSPYSSELGDYITIELQISNLGDVSITGYDVNLYLSEDQIFHGNGFGIEDNFLRDDGNNTFNEPLAPGESFTYTMTAYTATPNVPLTEAGIHYLFAVLDEERSFSESDKSNNIAVTPIELTSIDCYYNTDNEVEIISHEGYSGFIFAVRTEEGCSWIANGIEDWIGQPNNDANTGNAPVFSTISPNLFPFDRTGNITYGDETYSFIQEACPCELLTDDIKLQLALEEITDIDCGILGSIDISVSQGFPPYTYEWSNGVTTQDLEDLTEGGIYTVTVTDVSGCDISQSFTINDGVFVDATVSENDNIITANQNNAEYQWLDCTSEIPVENETNQSFSPEESGEYAVEITIDDCTVISECISITCNFSIDTSVFEYDYQEATYTNTVETLTEGNCAWIVTSENDWVTFINANYNGIGNIEFTLAENESPFEREGMIIINESIEYTFIQLGTPCENLDESDQITVSEINQINIDCFETFGSIDITVENGFPPYTFNWSNGDETEDLENVDVAGEYSVLITDSANCTYQESFTITENLEIDDTVTVDGNILTVSQVDATYQWLDCDNGSTPISGAIDQSYTATSTGNYAVEIVYGNCTIISECIFVDVLATDTSEFSEFKIFPNPTEGLLNIQLPRNINFKEVRYQVYSLEGRLVMNGIISNQEQVKVIDMEKLSTGNYFLKISSGDNSWTTQIIKK